MEDRDSSTDTSLVTDPWGGPPPRIWAPCLEVPHLRLADRRACYAGNEGYQFDLRVVRGPAKDPFGLGAVVLLAYEAAWYQWRDQMCQPSTMCPRNSRWVPASLVYVEALALEMERQQAA